MPAPIVKTLLATVVPIAALWGTLAEGTEYYMLSTR